MGMSQSTRKMSEDDIQFMMRELLYEFPLFIMICFLSKRRPSSYRVLMCEFQESVCAMHQAILNNDEMETLFCVFLMNYVNMEKQKSQLGASEIKDFKHMIPDFLIFYESNITKNPDGGVMAVDSVMGNGPFQDANMKYYTDLFVEKKNKIMQDHRIEEPQGGWTFDVWNRSRTILSYKLLDVENDPELQPWTIIRRRILGEEMFYCGSMREGVATTPLDLPDYGSTDIDIMGCSPHPGSLYDEFTRPGYTRIHISNGMQGHSMDANNFLLSSYYTLRYLEISEKDKESVASGKKIFRTISGPAVASFRDSDRMVKSMDRVCGFYCCNLVWPAIAEEWRVRDRSKLSGWPTQALIDRAVSHGTYVVPVAHKNSKNPDIEWRYSFSKSEIDLMESITKAQRKCYMITKHLCKLMFTGFRIFCSYFVKTSFFWMLEEMPAVYWSWMTMDDLVDHLLDKMIMFFAEQNLPNYFIKQANIIDHLPREHVITVIQKLKMLRLRREQGLPKYILKDSCLYLINFSVEPLDVFSMVFIPQHWVVDMMCFSKELMHSESPEILEILHKYRRFGQGSKCEPSYDPQSMPISISSSYQKIPHLLNKLGGLELSQMLEIATNFRQEEISEHLSILRTEIINQLWDSSSYGTGSLFPDALEKRCTRTAH